VSEIVPKEIAMPVRTMASLLLMFVFAASAHASDHSNKLSGARIATMFGGMQFTDEVHWREVYEKDGTLRSFNMGRKRVGTWRIRGSEICIDLGDDGDNNCFEVWQQGNRFVMQRDSQDPYPSEGILEKPTDTKPVVTGGKP
jgi:hypothetical protein